MDNSFRQVKRAGLERQKAHLIEEHAAASDQLNRTLADRDRIIIERQIKDLESKIDKLDRDLFELGNESAGGEAVIVTDETRSDAGSSTWAGASPLVRVSRPKPGELLPYLCDRSSQEVALDAALQHHKQNMPRRPFICVIHGDERECHDMFKRRLKEIILPDLLGLSVVQAVIGEYLVFRPTSNLNYADLLTVFRRNLAWRIADNRDASIDDIVQVLSQHKSAAVVSLHLNYEDWNRAGPDLINAYLKFWQDFPDMPSGRIFTCIFFTYKNADGLNLINRWRYKSANKSARNYFKQLASFPRDRIHCAVLPELCAISLGEAEDWIRDVKIFRGLCDVHGPHFCNVQKGMEKLREIYERPNFPTLKGCLPMQFLADELSKLLNDYSCR